jgi:hypothetical protein
MEGFLRILIPVILIYGFLRLCAAPLGLAWKLVVNGLCGFACLWLLNLISGFTGLLFPNQCHQCPDCRLSRPSGNRTAGGAAVVSVKKPAPEGAGLKRFT